MQNKIKNIIKEEINREKQRIGEGFISSILGLGLGLWAAKLVFGSRFKELAEKDPDVKAAVDEIQAGYDKLKQKHGSIEPLEREVGEFGDELKGLGSDVVNKIKGMFQQ